MVALWHTHDEPFLLRVDYVGKTDIAPPASLSPPLTRAFVRADREEKLLLQFYVLSLLSFPTHPAVPVCVYWQTSAYPPSSPPGIETTRRERRREQKKLPIMQLRGTAGDLLFALSFVKFPPLPPSLHSYYTSQGLTTLSHLAHTLQIRGSRRQCDERRNEEKTLKRRRNKSTSTTQQLPM